MRIVFYLDCVSPHQVPLAREVVRRVGADNFRYVYRDVVQEDRAALGWQMTGDANWFVHIGTQAKIAQEWIETADVILTGFRDFELFARRADKGLTTLYMSERWFKPFRIHCLFNFQLSRWLRLFHPAYFRTACRIRRLLRSDVPFYYLPCGIHAATDMARLCGLMRGDLRCLFRSPAIESERKPGGRSILAAKNAKFAKERDRTYCLDKMRMWGYYVKPSSLDAFPVQEADKTKPRGLKVLWVGRLLNWKRVDTIVQAVGEHANLKRMGTLLPTITLDVYGTGPEENRLKKVAAKYGDCIKFYPPVSIAEIRRLMREHDVYVLSSNGYEGWGAVVSEALEEDVHVLGTYEAGSGATMLTDVDLFHAGDWKRLMVLLERCMDEKSRSVLKGQGIGEWSAAKAADRLLALIETIQK